MTRTASCSCGQLSVRCAGEPTKVSLCHCSACQRRTGSIFGLAAFFPRTDLRVEGTIATFARTSDSGHRVVFRFCPMCGSTVYWEPARKPDLVAVAVGAFADPTFPAPSQAVNEADRHAWATIALPKS